MLADGVVVKIPGVRGTQTSMTRHHAIPLPCTCELCMEQKPADMRREARYMYIYIVGSNFCRITEMLSQRAPCVGSGVSYQSSTSGKVCNWR